MKRFNINHILATVNGASFIGIDMLTPVKLTGGKANPFQGRVTKQVNGALVMVFQNKHVNGYEAMVKRRLVSEGKDPDGFTVGPRSWGTRIDGMPLVEHHGQFYFEVIFKHPGDKVVLVDGQPTDVSTVTGYPPETDSGDQGGLDDKVIIRTVKLENITRVKADGVEYVGEFYYDPNEPLPSANTTPVVVTQVTVDEIGFARNTLDEAALALINSAGKLSADQVIALRKAAYKLVDITDDWLMAALADK